MRCSRRHLQRVLREELDIKNFFDKYGPSARDCYDFCKAGAVDQYAVQVYHEVNGMSWDLIRVILTSHPADIKAEEGFHKVLVIEPQPDNRAFSRTRIASKTVSQLLWERDSGENWRNHRKLFKTLLREPSVRPFCGKFFEPAFHVPVPVPKGLQLNPEGRLFFDDEKDPIRSFANYYYQPTSSVFLSLDSFAYDPDSRRINAFQVILVESHNFVQTRAGALFETGRRLETDGLRIRVIVVVFGNAEVELKVRKEVVDNLGLEVYTLQMTEHELYPQLFDS